MVVICHLSIGSGVIRKVNWANRSSGLYLLDLRWASFEHLKWTVQQLTQETHSLTISGACSFHWLKSHQGKGRKVAGGDGDNAWASW